MNVDQLGRTAGAEVRHHSNRGVDPMTMLDELRSTDVRRRRSSALSAVVVALVVAGLGWRVVNVHDEAVPPATPQPTVSAEPTQGLSTFNLTTPVTLTFPPGWYGVPSSASSLDVWSGGDGYGFSVAEDGFAPAEYVSTPVVDHTVTTSAFGLAQWLASRPYLTASDVTELTLSGDLHAWQVEVRAAPGAVAVAPGCGDDVGPGACIPLFVGSDGKVSGIWAGGRLRYTFVQMPDGSTTSISMWNFTDPAVSFDSAEVVLTTIRFARSS